MDGLTLDQFAVFVTVAEEGSFSAAAKRLNRAQSAITYAIHKLEEQSGDVLLFDRSAYRPSLTAAGHALLPTARALLHDVSRYRAQAADILSGVESQVRIAADLFTPLDCLYPALRAFEQTFPQVKIRLTIEFHDLVGQALAEGRADIAILSEMPAMMMGTNHQVLKEVEFVAVAAPHHPLASLAGPLQPDVLKSHLQLVVDSRGTLLGSKEFGVFGERKWYLTDLAAKLDMLVAGIGWGSMPRHTVAHLIAAGELTQLRPAQWEGAQQMPHMTLVVAHRPDSPPGPAGRWLIDQLRQEADQANRQ